MTTPRRSLTLALLILLAGLRPAATSAQSLPPNRLPEAPPAKLGFDPARLSKVDQAIDRAIADGKVPGAVVLVGRHGQIAHWSARGARALLPAREEMTRDTLFDMASLTKPVATASSIMILLEAGKLHLEDTLARLLPEFDNHGKGAITLEQLLRHRTGLIPDNPLSDYENGTQKSWESLANLDLEGPPGESFRYSDVNFLILGRIVEKVSGQPLNEFARDHVFKPLGMLDTGFRPIGVIDPTLEANMARTAPTGADSVTREIVHDPRSRALGGVAGHAGLFSTADDLALYAQTLLNKGEAPNGTHILKPETVSRFLDPGDTPSGQRRALGWDVSTGFSSPRGKLFGNSGFGHTGFTGTSIWVDPASDTFVILLSSRLHPDEKHPSPTRLRSEVATLVASAIVDPPLPAGISGVNPVLCGVDVLIRDGLPTLKGKKVGLVTNHTGLARDGRSTIDVLADASEFELVALFSPEHGIRGALDRTVPDGKDDKTGLPIYSLYGATRKPTPESLEGLDVLVYDIQDIGARFYTYISTLGLVMEAAKEKGIGIVVLDRPNPIGGVEVAGPVRDDEFASFIAFEALPVRHGMTVGELARLFNDVRKINVDLTVVPCEGWNRGDLFDRTGLLWTNPSPNMRSLTEALLYPGVGLLESTNLATGRGTDTPFERVGAPWIDPVLFSNALNSLELPGVRFLPVRFSPSERQYKDQDCAGVYIQITDRSRFEPLALAIGMACTLRDLYGEEWESKGFHNMVADNSAYQALERGLPAGRIETLWQEELDAFKALRKPFLLYGQAD